MSRKRRLYMESLEKVRRYISNLSEFYIYFIENKVALERDINGDRDRLSKENLDKFNSSVKYRNNQFKDVFNKIDEIKAKLFEGEIEIQFESFLDKELLNINWRNFHYISEMQIARLQSFQGSTFEKGQEYYDLLDTLSEIIRNATSFENQFINKIASLDIFSKIQGLDQNIVMIGSNGSGKSRFARALEGKIASGISIISAQKLLIYENPRNINLNEKMVDEVKAFQRKSKLPGEHDLVHSLTSDLQNLLLALLEEKLDKATEYYNTDEKEISLLNQTIEIWQSLIPHRKIVQSDKYKIIIETLDGVQYDFNQLSDGEKAIFYYIGHVLLAEENSYILIDEPENHLHLSISNTLWDKLELIRTDCKFIYITHDLDFAVSREDKTLIWNKNYSPPFTWDFEIVHEDDTLPEILMLEIIGSRKNILFCEGDARNSLDYKIYTKLFKDLNVIPVKGHEEVIKYCTAFNNNKDLSSLTAYGIIDGDTWTEDEVKGFYEKNIYVLPFNEIENAICQKEILQLVAKKVGTSEDGIEEFIKEFFASVESQKESISVWYANNRINNYLKRNLFKETKNIQQLKEEVNKALNQQEIEGFYSDMKSRIEKDILEQNYDSLLKYVNVKGTLTRYLANKHIINNFESRFIYFLGEDKMFRDSVNDLLIHSDLYELASQSEEAIQSYEVT